MDAVKQLEGRLERAEARLENLKELNAPQVLLDNENRAINDIKKKLEELQNK